MLNELLRQPLQRAVALSALPAMLVTAWLAGPAGASEPTCDPPWHEDHHTLCTEWDELGDNPAMSWSAIPPEVAG
jgi:hypothetical protein